ncbi:MAG: RNA-binding transcriptional accessory protein [bacterium]|nr:RNA-binding transcriptional accessory protein [bacterium]
MIEERYVTRIAEELSVVPERVAKAIRLMDEGATIPFIARYRKDVTGNLDEVKLEGIAERNVYFIGLTDRRRSILDTLTKQEQLTDELRAAIEACFDKTTLEDLYLPYKKRRRTKATVAREKGLEPLAAFLWEQVAGDQSIEEFAATFVRAEKAVASVEEALEGARNILAEQISLDPEVRAATRDRMHKEGKLQAHPTKNAEEKKTKFEAYYQFSEPLATIPSHRFLAVARGVKEGFLRMELAVDDAAMVDEFAGRFLKEPGSPFEPFVRAVVDDGYHRLLRPSVENEVVADVRTRADEEAIKVFRENAHNLLLAPPAGPIAVVGVDPGIRTGCKLAVVDSTGAFIESGVVYPHPPKNDAEGAIKILLALMEKHKTVAVAIGNGTASRETARFVKKALDQISSDDVFAVFVNESGASIYSTSKIAREEFPDLDATIRSAIAIARRLQDPLSELVKVDPKHVGVGQYQHDVNQKRLREGLQRTVVSCVNKVGVDLNTASAPLLKHISGIQGNVAQNIVKARSDRGPFKSRQELLEVDGVGPKVFEQCAGFLRITGGECVLDTTGIHPEAYPIVEKMAEGMEVPVSDLIANPAQLGRIKLEQFKTDLVGEYTLKDIREELAKPGRDPRTEFRAPKFLEGVESVADVEEGMVSEGVVTNVTDFGAFVDVGVHQDGLVHLSEMAHKFVQDPRQVVRVGDIVKVKVIKVDKQLPRISLSMKALTDPPPKPQRAATRRRQPERGGAPQPAGGQARPPQGSRDRAPDQRGDRRPDGRDDRSRRQGGQRGRGKPDRSRGSRGGGRPDGRDSGRPEKKPEPLNTQLADQLAALKDKFGKK